MAQYDRAILIVERENRTGVFELRNDLEPRGESRRSFLLGGRGGIVNEALSKLAQTTDNGDGEANSRQSFFVDGGGGNKERTFTAELVGGVDGETLQMGDGSSDETDSDSTTQWDATNSHHIAQWQVLDYWLSETTIGSESPAKLHYGQHSDGTQIEDGVYSPIDVVPTEWTVEKNRDQASSARVTIVLREAANFDTATDALSNDER